MGIFGKDFSKTFFFQRERNLCERANLTYNIDNSVPSVGVGHPFDFADSTRKYAKLWEKVFLSKKWQNFWLFSWKFLCCKQLFLLQKNTHSSFLMSYRLSILSAASELKEKISSQKKFFGPTVFFCIWSSWVLKIW